MTVKEKMFNSRYLTTILLQHDDAVWRERLLMANDEVMHPAGTHNMHYLPLFHGKYGHANPPQCYTIPAFSVLPSVTYKTPDFCCGGEILSRTHGGLKLSDELEGGL
jgi:hypothetical protein